jgi:hypothetical protein
MLKYVWCMHAREAGTLLAASYLYGVVVVVVTVGSRPKRVEPSGQLAEHCVETYGVK